MFFEKAAFVAKALSLTGHLPTIYGRPAANLQPTQMLMHIAALQHNEVA
jgi:hypothetical protein